MICSSWCLCHPIISCFIIGVIFPLSAYPGCHEKQTVKRVSACLTVLQFFDHNNHCNPQLLRPWMVFWKKTCKYLIFSICNIFLAESTALKYTQKDRKSKLKDKNENRYSSGKNGTAEWSVQSNLTEEESLWWEGFVKKVGLDPGVKALNQTLFLPQPIQFMAWDRHQVWLLAHLAVWLTV